MSKNYVSIQFEMCQDSYYIKFYKVKKEFKKEYKKYRECEMI